MGDRGHRPLGAARGDRAADDAYYTAIQQLAESGGEGVEHGVIARLQARTGALLHLATLTVFLLVLLDMIFKPGA